MRKYVGLILAAAVCFELGVMVVPAYAQNNVGTPAVRPAEFLKIDSLPVGWHFVKIKHHYVAAAAACLKDNGTPFEFKGEKYCRTTKTGAGTFILN